MTALGSARLSSKIGIAQREMLLASHDWQAPIWTTYRKAFSVSLV